MSIFKNISALFIIGIFLSGCGPKILFQDKCKEEYKNASCDALEKYYLNYRDKLKELKKTRKPLSDDPHSPLNWQSSLADSRGYIYYSLDSQAEKDYKWRLESIKDILIEKKCGSSLPKEEDYVVHIGMTNIESLGKK